MRKAKPLQASEQREFKRVVVISDFHCGHAVGLTHPDFNPKYSDGSRAAEASVMRSVYWSLYAGTLGELKPIDVLVVNGDCIDGKGEASGGTELLTANRNEQVEMATAAILEAEAKTIVMAYGTAYHTGKSEDFEDQIARAVNAAKIGSHDWIDVNGLVFDYKHHIAGSQIPHGRHTAAARDRLWNLMWSEFGEYPKADVIVRSHVHYFDYVGGSNWVALTTPALQGYGTKYGKRRMSGTVDFGLLSFDVWSKSKFGWKAHVWKDVRFGSSALKV